MKLRLAAAATVLLILFTVTPPDTPFPLCGFRRLTGHPCPLCGLTRALFALAKGHWRDAIHWNALSPLGFAMLFSLFRESAIRGPLWTAGTAAFAVYGICRFWI